MNKNIYEILNEKIIAKLEEGTAPWHKPWSAGLPKNIVSNKEYKGFNIFKLGSEEFNNPLWGTFKQFKALGGYVEHRSKGTTILFWKMNKKEDKKTGEIETFPMLRYYTVFNIDQTSLAEDDRFKVVKNNNNKIENCELIVDNYEGRPKIVHANSANAYFEHGQDIINVPEINLFDEAEFYYSTLFHEMGHSTGHHSRLKRREKGETRSRHSVKYLKEELVAELTATYLGGDTGISYHTFDNSVSYLEGYLSVLRNNFKFFVEACSAAQKAVEYIKGVNQNVY